MAIFTSTTYPWITVNPSGGTGSTDGESVSITTAAHTGRASRTGAVKFSGTTGTKAVTVTQSAHPLYISGFAATDSTVFASGETITISGYSNCPGLTFACSVNDDSSVSGQCNLNVYYTGSTPSPVDEETGVTTLGDVTFGSISYYQAKSFKFINDNGDNGQYNFTTKFTFDRNTESGQRRINIYVMGQSGTTSATCITSVTATTSVYQLAGTFNVTPTELTPSYTGATSAVTVTSTSDWIVTENS